MASQSILSTHISGCGIFVSVATRTGSTGCCSTAIRCFNTGSWTKAIGRTEILTAPTDEALRFDIEMTKRLGFNLARKHVKVEPARWYYWCDKLGLLVWQDMPSAEKMIRPGQPDIERSPESATGYDLELKAIIDSLRNHPSIVMWVPFNEGWGQFDTERVVNWLKGYDPSRLVNQASGWVDRGVGDVNDIHIYPGPATLPPEPNRAIVLGEFGGLGGGERQQKLTHGVTSSEKSFGRRSLAANLAERRFFDRRVNGRAAHLRAKRGGIPSPPRAANGRARSLPHAYRAGPGAAV